MVTIFICYVALSPVTVDPMSYVYLNQSLHENYSNNTQNCGKNSGEVNYGMMDTTLQPLVKKERLIPYANISLNKERLMHSSHCFRRDHDTRSIPRRLAAGLLIWKEFFCFKKCINGIFCCHCC